MNNQLFLHFCSKINLFSRNLLFRKMKKKRRKKQQTLYLLSMLQQVLGSQQLHHKIRNINLSVFSTFNFNQIFITLAILVCKSNFGLSEDVRLFLQTDRQTNTRNEHQTRFTAAFEYHFINPHFDGSAKTRNTHFQEFYIQ